MNQTKLTIGFIALAIIAVIVSQSIFNVDQREQALVLQLGNPVGEPRGPGLHFKLPLVQEVRIFDRRILSVDPNPEQVVISSASLKQQAAMRSAARNSQAAAAGEGESDAESTEQAAPEVINAEDFDFSSVSGEPIIVDSFARYKISDPLQFLKKLGTIRVANERIETILNDAARAVLGKTTLKELLSDERNNVMNDIRSRVNQKTKDDELGIEIVDVRIVRADLTSELRTSTVRRMISELQERATETRAKGEERAKEIRSTADKERTVILAEAERDAQIIRGEGDNTAIKIYADAFNQDKEFYSFLRSMEAYKNTLADSETQLILSPDSEFFRYFEGRN